MRDMTTTTWKRIQLVTIFSKIVYSNYLKVKDFLIQRRLKRKIVYILLSKRILSETRFLKQEIQRVLKRRRIKGRELVIELVLEKVIEKVIELVLELVLELVIEKVIELVIELVLENLIEVQMQLQLMLVSRSKKSMRRKRRKRRKRRRRKKRIES